MTYEKDQLVKYATPQNEYEAEQRFVVIEDRDTRLYVGCIVDPKKFPLGLTECYAKSEYVLAEVEA